MKKTFIILLFSIILIVPLNLVMALPSAPSGWYYGDLHSHTEYSSVLGGCLQETKEIWGEGHTISELKTQAKDTYGLGWFSITDHSYCLDSTYEFFAYANKTSNMSINNKTSTWNVTII